MLLAKAHMALHSNLSPALLLGYLGGLVRFLWHNNIVFIKFSVELESLMASAFTGARGLPSNLSATKTSVKSRNVVGRQNVTKRNRKDCLARPTAYQCGLFYKLVDTLGRGAPHENCANCAEAANQARFCKRIVQAALPWLSIV